MDDIPLTRQQITGIGRPSELVWDRFLAICETLAKTGAKYQSCTTNGFSYWTVTDLIREREKAGDPRWKQAWDLAQEHYRDSLEAEARRRAFEGVDKPVFYKGKKVATVKEYSDRLLELLLRGERPEKFRDNVKLDANVMGGVLVVPAKMSVEEYLNQKAENPDG